MLTLYVSKEALLRDFRRPNFTLVEDANAYFDQLAKKGTIKSQDCLSALEVLSNDKFEIETLDDLLNLSTSIKTMVLAEKYPDIILTTGDITEEAAQMLLSVFEGSDRAFIYYPPADLDNGNIYIRPLTILSETDCIEAIVVEPTDRTQCKTYGEIEECLTRYSQYSGTKFAGESVFPLNQCFPELDFSKDITIPVEEFDDAYNLIHSRLMDRCDSRLDICAHKNCIYRIRHYDNCFTVGGQFIAYPNRDKNGNSTLEIHAPFGNEPSSEQIGMIYEYAGEHNLICDEESREPNVAVSACLVERLGTNFEDNHLISYYISQNGDPVINNITYLENAVGCKAEYNQMVTHEFMSIFNSEAEADAILRMNGELPEPDEFDAEYSIDELPENDIDW